MTKQEELQNARAMLQGWMLAETKLMTSQDYTTGSQRNRRAELSQVRASVKYWKSEVDRLEGKSRVFVRQVIPRSI